MAEKEMLIALTAEQKEQNHIWWNALSKPWQQAYNEVMLRRSATEMPDDQTLHNIREAVVIRFAGPNAPYPNMTFELEDLSGLTGLMNLNLLVVNDHKLTALESISHLEALISLFVINNQIASLRGVESFKNLTELYFQGNQVSSLKPLENLIQLATINCTNNPISLLDGIGPQHKANLKNFVCLPNDQLLESEIIRMEREVGIRCVRG